LRFSWKTIKLSIHSCSIYLDTRAMKGKSTLISTRNFLTSLLFLLIISILLPPVRSQVAVPYDWIEIGAYATYTMTLLPEGLIFPNGTIVEFWGDRLSTPAVLEWTIIGKVNTSVRLNVTFFISYRNVVFRKTLMVNVDMYMRDSIIDGEPIGKTCFWAKPYAEPGEKIVMYGMPPDEIVGNVTRTGTVTCFGKPVKVYFLNVFQVDPAIWLSPYPRFVWYTGMAEEIALVGPMPIDPKAAPIWVFPNATYIIKRFASTPLGERLCLYGEYDFLLNSTNVRLGPKPEEDTSGMSLWRYYPYVFIAALVVSTGVFILVYRKRHEKGKVNKTSQ